MSRWIAGVFDTKSCVIGELMEGLGRLGFATEALEYDKPFLAPLYTFASLHPRDRTVKLPLFVLLTLIWIKTRIERRRTYPCEAVRLDMEGALRVDAKVEGDEVGIGGWAPRVLPDGTIDKWGSPWFMVRLDKASAPWAYAKGQPFRSIMALELFATTVVVALLGPQLLSGRPSRGTVVLPSLADNLGLHTANCGCTIVVTKLPWRPLASRILSRES